MTLVDPYNTSLMAVLVIINDVVIALRSLHGALAARADRICYSFIFNTQ